MKKLLIVLLAMVLVIGMATSAVAFTDTDDLSTVEQDAVYRLYALGILNGYPDGSFGADNNITRAEFAKIACIAAGLGDVTDLMENTPSSFSDVAVGMWYTGYVNVASSQGFINGYPDGTFRPNDPITMAEVVTILMRIAGYNDNLPGPWPFDYIAEAGKQDVTDDVTFVSNIAATRAAVAVMVNNLLDVSLVDYDNDINDFVDAEDGTVLEDSFGAGVYDIMFYNDYELPDALDGWAYSDFDENEIELSFSYFNDDDDYEDYYTSTETLVMNEACYIAGGMNLTDIGGMEADIITNDDDEVIYIKLVSTVIYSDDVDPETCICGGDLEVNGDEVDTVAYYMYWWDDYDYEFDYTDSGYAKVFYNEDGEVYAVSDLYDGDEFAPAVILADSYDADDEILGALVGDDVELEDEDFVVLKDGVEIEVTDIAAGDVVYVLYPHTGADVVLMVGSMVEGALTEGEDYTITVADSDYNYDWWSTEFTTEGIDGDYNELDDLGDLEDVFDADVQLALFLNPYEVAYLVSDVDATSSTVYGIVTDLTISGLFDNITDVTILNQDGEEVTYDLDDDDIFTYGVVDDEGTLVDESAHNVELGTYVEVELDADGVITVANEIVLADYDMEYWDEEMTISGSKIKIDGTWFKVTEDTLFFEAVYDGDYDSEDFDEANLLVVDDVLDADTITADVYVMNDGGTLDRLYLVNSSIAAGDEGYSFVDRMFTNSSGDFVEMMDGTIAEIGDDLDYDTFYSYNIVDGEIDAEIIFYTRSSYSADEHDGSPVEDGFWVLGATGLLAVADTDYTFSEFIVDLDDFSGDTLELEGEFYTLTSDTEIFVVDDEGVVDTGDEDDIEDAYEVGAIADEDGNLLFVFVIPSI